MTNEYTHVARAFKQPELSSALASPRGKSRLLQDSAPVCCFQGDQGRSFEKREPYHCTIDCASFRTSAPSTPSPSLACESDPCARGIPWTMLFSIKGRCCSLRIPAECFPFSLSAHCSSPPAFPVLPTSPASLSPPLPQIYRSHKSRLLFSSHGSKQRSSACYKILDCRSGRWCRWQVGNDPTLPPRPVRSLTPTSACFIE